MAKSIFTGGACHRVYSKEQISELEKSAGLAADIITRDNFFESVSMTEKHFLST